MAMAREVSADANRGQQFTPALSNDELAFYDAVAQNESAVTEMGTGVLADIARDLVKSLRRDVTTDWVSRDDVRAKLRSTIKRLLMAGMRLLGLILRNSGLNCSSLPMSTGCTV